MTKRDCTIDGRLQGPLRHEFFVQHLPYRLSQLLALQRWENELKQLIPEDQHRRFAPCHIEATALMARAFLNMLGISYSRTKAKLVRTSFKPDDDITAIELGGQLVDIDSISETDQDIIKRVLVQANKATAHITWSDYLMDGWQCLPEGVEITLNLLRSHLYEPAGYSMEQTWHLPSEITE